MPRKDYELIAASIHHSFNRNNDYMLQLPDLNEDGNAIVADIKAHNASELVERGTHRLMNVAGAMYLLTPIKPAVTAHVFQIGEPAV